MGMCLSCLQMHFKRSFRPLWISSSSNGTSPPPQKKEKKGWTVRSRVHNLLDASVEIRTEPTRGSCAPDKERTIVKLPNQQTTHPANHIISNVAQSNTWWQENISILIQICKLTLILESGWFTSAQIQANLGELLNQSNQFNITQCSSHVKLKVYNSLTGKQSECILQDLTTQAVGCTHIEFESIT